MKFRRAGRRPRRRPNFTSNLPGALRRTRAPNERADALVILAARRAAGEMRARPTSPPTTDPSAGAAHGRHAVERDNSPVPGSLQVERTGFRDPAAGAATGSRSHESQPTLTIGQFRTVWPSRSVNVPFFSTALICVSLLSTIGFALAFHVRSVSAQEVRRTVAAGFRYVGIRREVSVDVLVEASRVMSRHCATSEVAASLSSVVSRGSAPCTVFRQSVHVVYEKVPVEERTRRPLLLSVVERRRPLGVAGVQFPP